MPYTSYLLQDGENDPLGQLTDEQLKELADAWAAAGAGEAEEVPTVTTEPPELSAGEIAAGGARELAGGALFEFSDEAEAAARARFSNKSYEELLREIRQNRARFSEAYPGTAMALNVTGGIGSMFVPGVNVIGRTAQAATGISRLASPAARVAASGALAGGVAGAGSGEDAGSRLANAATGAVLGGTMGAGVYGGTRGAQWLRDAFTARGAEMSEQQAAQQAAMLINRRLGESGMQPDQIADLMALEQQYGIPSVMGTATPELARLTELAAQTPSGGQTDLARRLFEQQAGAPERVQRRIRESIPTPDYFAAEDRIVETLRNNAQRAYGAVGDVEIRDPRILAMLDDPDIRGAYADALANVRRDMTAASLRGEDPAQFQLREIFEPVLNEEGALVGLSATGKQIPDIRTLNQIKIALDRKIDGLYSTGKGGEATALKNLRNAFVQRLDDVGPPEYRAARQQYKGDIEIREALEAGRDANKLRWQEVNKMVRDFSPGELQAFKTGYVQRLMQGFEDTSRRRNFANEIINNASQRRKLEALMEPGEFQVFEAAMRREAELFDTISRVTGGSQTAGRMLMRADVDEQLASGNLEDAASLLLNPTPGNIASRALRIVTNMRNANVSRATYTQLARMLRAGTPDEIDDVLRQLEEAGPAQRAADRATERGASKAGAAAGVIVAPSPEMERERLPETPEIVVPDIGEPVEGLSVMPAPVEEEGPGGVDISTAISSLMPDYTAIFGDGSVSGPSGSLSGEQVAKALGLPLQVLQSYLTGGR